MGPKIPVSAPVRRPQRGCLYPRDQFLHQAWRIKWRCRFKYDTDAFAVGFERLDMVVVCFVFTAMPLIFFGVLQQVNA